MFSIVIPVHNKEEYIHRTLESVLSQTFDDFEVILVNDGSQDKSGEICDEYAKIDKRIKVIHQINGGVSNARNTGIKAAKNELIALIDADDFWYNNYLYEVSKLINKYPDLDIYSSKYGIKQNDITINSKSFFNTNEQYLKFNLIELFTNDVQFPLHTSSVVLRKSAIIDAGYFDERIAMFEDYDLFVRMALKSKVGYLNIEPLSFYNLDVPAESKARGVIPKIEKHWIYYFDKFEEAAKQNPSLKKMLDRAILTQLIGRRVRPGYMKEVRPFLRKVDKKNYPLKYKLIYNTPPFVGNIILKLNLWIKKR